MPSAARQKHNVDDLPCAHPNYLRAVCEVIRQEGGDLDAVLAEAGTHWGAIKTAEHMLPFRVFRSLVRALQQLAKRPGFAVELGLQKSLASHGILGLALASSAHVRQALAVVERFLPMVSANAVLHIQPKDDGLWLEIQPANHLDNLSVFVQEHVAAALSVIFTSVANQSSQPLTLELPWAEPAWSAVYRPLAGRVRFRAGRTAYWLPNAFLDRPCPTASASTFDMAWRQCEMEAQRSRRQRPLTRSVIDLLRGGTPAMFRIEVAAAFLGISRVTLFRRLQAEGTSFAALATAERQRAALWQLRYSNKTIANIALALGYRDFTSFSRTFRRWFGATPSAMREGAVPWPSVGAPGEAPETLLRTQDLP